MEDEGIAQVSLVANQEQVSEGVDRLLLTIKDAATALSVGRTTIYALIASGELAVVHIGRSSRVPAEAVREFVAAKRANA
jgi:excisionase family DNA binding protein